MMLGSCGVAHEIEEMARRPAAYRFQDVQHPHWCVLGRFSRVSVG